MASRYWVGGTAAWDGTAGTKWALTSGGAGGQAVPTSADDVFFTNLSTGTCTISTGNTGAKSITCTGFAGTLAGTATISVSGSVTLTAGMTASYAGVLMIIATGTVTSAGKTFCAGLFINGTGITVSLGDAFSTVAGGGIYLFSGTFNLNNFTATTDNFSSNNSGTRAIAFGTGNIALVSTAAATKVLDMANATNFTYTGTGGFIRNQAATATVVFGSTGGTVTNAPNLTVNAGASALTITSGTWFNNLIFTGSTSAVTAINLILVGNLTLGSSAAYATMLVSHFNTGTITSNGKALGSLVINAAAGFAVTCADALYLGGALTLFRGTLKLKTGVTNTVASLATSGTTLKYLESTLAGTQATISDTSGTNTVTYLSIKDSNATGGAVFDATDPTNVNVSNNTGWDFGAAAGGGSFIAFFM